ncbi:MAG: DUF1800 family protein, partial [Candidatus Acidiferrales bacterium]
MRLHRFFALCTLPAVLAAGQVQHLHSSVQLTRQRQALQMLNRFTFGPRPGEVDAVTKQGPDAWFEQQLNPSAIPDTALDQRLAAYP